MDGFLVAAVAAALVVLGTALGSCSVQADCDAFGAAVLNGEKYVCHKAPLGGE
jgi:hypothetical protein